MTMKDKIFYLLVGAIGSLWFVAGAWSLYVAINVKVEGKSVDYPHVVYRLQEKVVETPLEIPRGYTDVRYAAKIINNLPACALVEFSERGEPLHGEKYCTSIDPTVLAPSVCEIEHSGRCP